MSYNTIAVEITDSVAQLTFNRPQHLNAMTVEMGDEIKSAVADINAEPGVIATIVTGAGRAFCAGGELKMLQALNERSNAENKEFMIAFYRKFLSLTELKMPSIAAINGPAMGAGLCLGIACDIRIAAESAKMAFNFVRIGISPGMAATHLVSRAVGTARACDLLMTGRTFTGEEAAQMGLVNEAVATERVLPRAQEYAALLAEGAPLANRLCKKGIYFAAQTNIDSALEYEAFSQSMCYNTSDFTEGVTAAAQKRRPQFKGK